MRSLRLVGLLAFALVASQRPALAQDTSATHRAAVGRLLTVMHVRELTEQSTETMLKGQLQAMPQLAPYANVLRDFYHEQLNWNTLEPEYTRLYLEVFSEAELSELATFYETPLGQKLIAKMPLLLAKTNEATTRRVQTAMPQLMQRLQAAAQEKTAAPADPGRTRKP